MRFISLILTALALTAIVACMSATVDDRTGTITESVGPLPIRTTEASPAEVPPWLTPGFAQLPEPQQVERTITWNHAHGDVGRVEWSWVTIIPSVLLGLRQLSPTGLRNWMALLARGSAAIVRWQAFLSLLGPGTTPEAARPKK